MNDQDFDGIFHFLHATEPEVVGHARAELSPDERAEIEAFQRGDSFDENRRDSLMSLLARNSVALEYLVSLR